MKRKLLMILSLMALVLFSGCTESETIVEERFNCAYELNDDVHILNKFIDDEPMSQQSLIRIQYDENCFIKNIYEFGPEDDSYETIYFTEINTQVIELEEVEQEEDKIVKYTQTHTELLGGSINDTFIVMEETEDHYLIQDINDNTTGFTKRSISKHWVYEVEQ